MSSETGAAPSAWTVDTLHQHLIERSELLAAAFRQQLQDQRATLLQQTADLRALTAERFADLQTMLDERYATQTRALDGAFLAQQTAVRTAMEAAEKAVQAALVSAEKAVGKAELAADKRLESVNEFRQQLYDQTATLRAQTDANARRIAELELRLTSRLDTEQGSRAGGLGTRTEYRAEAASQRAGNGQIMQFAGLLLLALAIIASVLIAVLHKG